MAPAGSGTGSNPALDASDLFSAFPWWEPATADDVAVVSAQLGRAARGILAVAWRCGRRNPGVVVVRPLLPLGGPGGAAASPDAATSRPSPGSEMPGVPFPTTFWLSCPALVAAVSALESEGWIGRLEQELAQDPGLAAGLACAHREAAELRRALMTPAELARLWQLSPRAAQRLWETGVAGIAHPAGIKCLHAHLADFLARRRNPVGRRVAELVRERAAREPGAAQPCRFCAGTPYPALERALVGP